MKKFFRICRFARFARSTTNSQEFFDNSVAQILSLRKKCLKKNLRPPQISKRARFEVFEILAKNAKKCLKKNLRPPKSQKEQDLRLSRLLMADGYNLVAI